jgi:dethiobiotin synthetase
MAEHPPTRIPGPARAAPAHAAAARLPRAVAVIGTDTGVGKTRVATLLVHGLRALGERVWIHKPVACGGFDGSTCADGRQLASLCADGQEPATVCPWQFPAEASPHLAAAAAGAALDLDQLAASVARLAGDHQLVVEGIGGLLVPLTAARATVLDLLLACALPALLVTRPHLGTLNHTALTVAVARARGLPLIGLVLNAHAPVAPGLAGERAAAELTAITGLPLIAALPFQPPGSAPADERAAALALARGVLAWHGAAGSQAGGR